jgi:hypothetical protein
MDIGVGVADNGIGLINGQTTKQDSIGPEEGEGLFTVNIAGVKDMGPRGQMDLGHVLKVFREPIRSFHDLLTEKPPSLLIMLWVEFNLNGLLNNAIHISGFHGEDGRTVELNDVSSLQNFL